MNRHPFIIFASFVIATLVSGLASAATTPGPARPAVCFWSPTAAESLRRQSLARDPAVAVAIDQLIKRADASMKLGPFSVVDKTMLPPSGDKHDFSTLGRYYWPNPHTPDGMPWIRQDGKTNPDYYNGRVGDSERFIKLVDCVVTLSRAAYLTDQPKYADRAALLLRTWFISPATRMTPNARYAARFPGNWDGQCYGIHGTRQLMDIADAIGLLCTSPAWTADDQQAMTDWFGQYLTWLTTSDLGKQEASQKNNHSIAYDCLVVRLAIFTGKPELARQVLEDAPTKRFAMQIDPDGKMPLELARATPWEYTRYAIEFCFKLATLGDREGVDLWHYRSPDGRSIRGALDYLARNIVKTDGTIDQNVLAAAEPERLGPMLQIAARVYHEPRYRVVMQQIGFDGTLSTAESSVNGRLRLGTDAN